MQIFGELGGAGRVFGAFEPRRTGEDLFGLVNDGGDQGVGCLRIFGLVAGDGLERQILQARALQGGEAEEFAL